MNYLSVCSGIEAATVAWHPIGWTPVAFSEIEKFPSAVLAHHYPTVPNMGDMTKFNEWKLNDSIDLLVGGTPCQSFSVAGLRKGLDDPRGNLMLTYLAIAERFKPRWLVWENVPGVLSSNGGKDFGSLLGGLAELGYGFAYRVLDAQYFGVPQRRRRVFVVGCLGDWRAAAAVLFERHSMQGHSAPKRETREEFAPSIAPSPRAQSQPSHRLDSEAYIGTYCMATGQGGAEIGAEISSTLNCNHEAPIAFYIQGNIIGRQDHNGGNGMGFSEEVAATLTKADQHGVAVVHGTQDPCISDIAFALGRNNGQENALIEAIPLNTMTIQGRPSDDLNPRMGSGIGLPGDPQNTLTKGHSHGVFYKSQVRRLTPVECARLQGFPDNYLDIIYGRKLAVDGPKYKALGNSMAAPVMAWIGKRIQLVEELSQERAA